MFTWERMEDSFVTESRYLVFSVLGNDLVGALIKVPICLSKKGKLWNALPLEKDQLLVLYVSRLLSSKPMLLCFKKRLKEQKRHPKQPREHTAKPTQALFPSCEPNISTWESPFNKYTMYGNST